jgi:hypothetical protein
MRDEGMPHVLDEALGQKGAGTKRLWQIGAGSSQNKKVGLAPDAKYDEVSKEVMPTFYIPLREGGGYFELRTAVHPKALIRTVRRAVREIDPKLAILSIQTQTEQIDKTLFGQRLICRGSAQMRPLSEVR